jgi:hypothetical protein
MAEVVVVVVVVAAVAVVVVVVGVGVIGVGAGAGVVLVVGAVVEDVTPEPSAHRSWMPVAASEVYETGN